MIITCPACTTKYYAGETTLGNRARKVRCVKCAHQWMLQPEILEAEPEEPSVAASTFASQPLTDAVPKADAAAPMGLSQAEEMDIYSTPRPRNRILDRIATLILAVMILTGLVAGAVQYRAQLARMWPSLSGIYAAAGLPINSVGLEIRKTQWQIESRNGMPMLVVKGEIANTTTRAADVPRLSLVLRDAKQHELYRWNAAINDVKRLAPGEVAPFTTTLESPPLEAHDIEIRFLSGS